MTDLEFRVWVQYILSADDFGVMRCSPVTLQADNDHLANRPKKIIQRCLDRLVTHGLLRAFEHQKRRYVYQPDWQDYQRIGYPRGTAQPLPLEEAITHCSLKTKALFGRHPSKVSEILPQSLANIPEILPKDSGNVSEMFPKDLPPSRARETLTLTQTQTQTAKTDANAKANAVAETATTGASKVLDAFGVGWQRLYGHAWSLQVNHLDVMRVEEQVGKHTVMKLLASIDAYFASADGYLRQNRHPFALWLKDPLKHLAVIHCNPEAELDAIRAEVARQNKAAT